MGSIGQTIDDWYDDKPIDLPLFIVDVQLLRSRFSSAEEENERLEKIVKLQTETSEELRQQNERLKEEARSDPGIYPARALAENTRLREENEQLKKRIARWEERWPNVGEVDELESRLSAAIEAMKLKKEILKDRGVEDWMLDDGVMFVDAARLSAAEGRLLEAREEVKKLAACVVRAEESLRAERESCDGRYKAEIEDLQSRLSAVEEEARLWKEHQERTKAIKKDLQSRLFEAEEALVNQTNRLNEERERRERAEEVVEAAKRSPQSDELFQAVLQYEEGR